MAIRLPVVESRNKISFSEWMSFRDNCEMRWYLDYVKEFRKKDESIALDFGSDMHSTIEILLNKDKSKRCSLDEAINIFEDKLNTSINKLTDIKAMHYGPWQEDDKDAPHNLLEAGKRILKYIPSVVDIFESEIVELEYKLDDSLSRSDGDIRFVGFIDFITLIKDKRGKPVLILGDFKTCKWGWPKNKKEDPNVLAQVRLYKHFFCKKTGLDPKKVRTYFFLLKKTPGKKDQQIIEPIRVSSSERDISNTIEMMQKDITKMRSGILNKNTKSCSKPWGMCPYYNTEHCSGKDD